MRLPSREMQRREEQERVEGFPLGQLRTPIAYPPSPQILLPPQIVPPPDIPPTPGNFWKMMTTEHSQKLKIIYREIVHWRPKFFTLKKNKTGEAFIDTLHTTLSALLDRSQDALLIVMVMPQIVLPRMKSENDGSQNQTLTRRLGMWLNGQFDNLFE